ncbi:MAG: CAP domain-containing protein [Bacteroidota bacterium]|nr:CAP domain-containing protein [Bacteroidota bacterium]
MTRIFLFCSLFCPLMLFSQISVIELAEKPVPEPVTRATDVDQWNSAQKGYADLAPEAKQMYYWTNYARLHPNRFWDSVVQPLMRVFPNLVTPESRSLRSELLAMAPLPAFQLNPILIGTAQKHASDIGAKQAPPSHNATNGTDFGTRIKNAGIRYCASENISLSSQSILLSVVLLYLDIGLPDLGHRKTLFDRNLREIGIGSALYGKDQHFLVQDFACLQ